MERETTADVAIVGADLAGLVAGAILAKHGKRVVILEHAESVGGRSGAMRTPDGYWIDFAHRDAHGVGDCQFPWHHGAEAAREADVEIVSRPIKRVLRVHRVPDGPVLDGGDWSAGGFLAAARDFFECPADGQGELRDVLARLAAAKPGEVEAALPVGLGAWVDANVRHPGVRSALLLMAAVIFHPRPAEASAGRFMLFFQNPKGLPHIADDAEVGGMQGLMEPWARAIRARGGEIVLGWKPVEIVIDGGRVRGAVAVDRASLVREVRAPFVISNVSRVGALRPRRRAPLSARVRLGRPRAGALSRRFDRLACGSASPADRTRDRTARRSPGLEPAPARCGGCAPLCRRLPHPVAHERSRGATREASPVVGDGALLRRRHDLGPALDRGARAPRHGGRLSPPLLRRSRRLHRVERAPVRLGAAVESWSWAPVKRHELTVPGMDGLLLASATLEAPAGIVDIGAYAGRVAAHAVLGR
jgi:hypothetical protein